VRRFTCGFYHFILCQPVQQPRIIIPNFCIYDILIAFFWWFSWCNCDNEVENPLPGVAIATALMPPLCVPQDMDWHWGYKFFLALYLYSINCVFICISTFFIVKYLKYYQKSNWMIDHKNR
jgi:hypothetical protein